MGGTTLAYNPNGYSDILKPSIMSPSTSQNFGNTFGNVGGNTTQASSTFGNINGAIGAGANVIGAVGNTLGAYWSYKNGKAQTKAMQQQVDLMDKQMQIENERYNKRESERLENAAEFQKQGESFSQGIQKSNNDLPTNRI